MWLLHGRGKVHRGFSWETLSERYHMKGQGTDGRKYENYFQTIVMEGKDVIYLIEVRSKCHSIDQIKKNEMGRTCGTYVKWEGHIQSFSRKT